MLKKEPAVEMLRESPCILFRVKDLFMGFSLELVITELEAFTACFNFPFLKNMSVPLRSLIFSKNHL